MAQFISTSSIGYMCIAGVSIMDGSSHAAIRLHYLIVLNTVMLLSFLCKIDFLPKINQNLRSYFEFCRPKKKRDDRHVINYRNNWATVNTIYLDSSYKYTAVQNNTDDTFRNDTMTGRQTRKLIVSTKNTEEWWHIIINTPLSALLLPLYQ